MELVISPHQSILIFSISDLLIHIILVIIVVSSHRLLDFIVIFAYEGDPFFIKLTIETAFNSQFLYHFALITYTPFSLIVVLYFSFAFWDFSLPLFTFQEIESKSQE